MFKHITMPLAVCLLISGTIFAAPVRQTDRLSHVSLVKNPKGELSFNGYNFKVADHSEKLAGRPFREAEMTPVITTAPGEKSLYYKKSEGWFNYDGRFINYSDMYQSAEINRDNDYVYLYNILSYSETNSYVAGTIADNMITVPMDQTVLELDPELGLNIGLLKTVLWSQANPDYEEEGDPETVMYIDFEYSTDFPEVNYLIGEDGSLTLIIPRDPNETWKERTEQGKTFLNPGDYGYTDYALGFYWTDDFTWTGDCDLRQEYTEFNIPQVEVPEGLKFNTYTYINMFGEGVIASIARQDDALYIKGLSPYAPEAVVKADLITTEHGGLLASVAPNQFVGSFIGYYYILSKTVVAVPDDFGSIDAGYYTLAPDTINSYFLVETDPETGEITSLISELDNFSLGFNISPDYFDPIDVFEDLVLTAQESFEGEPCTPDDVFYGDYAKWMGLNFLFFHLPPFAADGSVIDVNNLYYTIYLNGEPYVFQQTEGFNLLDELVVMYQGVESPMIEVPYMFDNGMDLWKDDVDYFYVGLYIEDIETLGVQAIYRYGDEASYSELITVTVADDADAQLNYDAEAEIGIIKADSLKYEYYDLNGRRVINPGDGIFILHTILPDGSVKVKKVVKNN